MFKTDEYNAALLQYRASDEARIEFQKAAIQLMEDGNVGGAEIQFALATEKSNECVKYFGKMVAASEGR